MPDTGASYLTRPAMDESEAERLGLLVLAADDNSVNRTVLRRQLQRLGYACHIFDDGAQALAALRKSRYGLLLTDCEMPVMDGYALATEIRSSTTESFRNIPIVAVTANALQGSAEKCLAAGMNDYLSKPVALQQLADKLDAWLPVRWLSALTSRLS